ncbi:PAS domain S-box protein [Pedobacter sp. KBS0701]|uniref:PAS domain-containing sensor histidine kinase n=1 Tax=Pedobacter sp. KBS0701 TaxID=2578106 RepID=UPI00110D7F1F|nr:ATP-binding protein [Pedobacter sp. KBS0701]QDW24384.1 PAS domain S-box protein [Pedobacter sp. KBS0701]
MDHRYGLMSSEELLEIYSLTKTATSVHRGEDAVIESANQAMLKIWGKDSNVIGKSLLDALPELGGQPYPDMFRKAWLDGKTCSGQGSPAELKVDGKISTYYFDFEYLPIKNSEGKVIAVLNSAIDVTERVLKEQAIEKAEQILTSLQGYKDIISVLEETRKELHELNSELEERVERRVIELAESEERFQIMAEGTELLISVGDEDNNRIYFNKRWENVTGRKIEELLRNGWVDLIHPEEKQQFINAYMESFKKREVFNMEFRMPDSKGEYRWYLCQCPPRFRSDGSFAGYIASCLDITMRKNEEIRKNEFIGMISHELRTPLTSLNGFIQIMKTRLDAMNRDNFERALNKSQIQINKMSKMIAGFLDISKLESGSLELQQEPFQLSELLKEVVEELSFMHSTHKITFQSTCSLRVFADRNKISAVIYNLVGNAIKYAPPGSNIKIQCSKDKAGLMVRVKDQGPGIEKSEMEKIFGRYYRSKGSPTVSGFGIGLFLCREILIKHEGNIWVESEEGNGAQFYFTLPEHAV